MYSTEDQQDDINTEPVEVRDINGRIIFCIDEPIAKSTAENLPNDAENNTKANMNRNVSIISTSGDSVVLPWPSEIKHVRDTLLCGRHVNDDRSIEWERILRIVEIYERNNDTNGVDEFINFLQNLLPTDERYLIRHNGQFTNLRTALGYCQNEKGVFFKNVVPWMIDVLRNGPEVFKDSKDGMPSFLPILRQGSHIDQEMTLTHPQCVVLLVCSFFSLFPHRYLHSHDFPQSNGKGKKLPHVNCISLFNASYGKRNGYTDSSLIEKVLCLIHTFTYLQEEAAKLKIRGAHEGKTVAGTPETTNTTLEPSSKTTLFPFPNHLVQFVRCVKSKQELYSLREVAVTRQLSLTEVNWKMNDLIEDINSTIQVDFANKELGGGVLHRGCVQEEIRFIVCADMIVSRIICEPLLPNEAVLIIGCRKYIRYSGYAGSFKFNGLMEVNSEPEVHVTHKYDTSQKIVRSCVVAMDAINFRVPETQYYSTMIDRELNKAIVGFYGSTLSSLSDGRPPEAISSLIHNSSSTYQLAANIPVPVATGHWGCGCYNGDKVLKFLIQWLAASICGRPMVYCTLGDVSIIHYHATIVNMGVNIGQLYEALVIAAKRYLEIKEGKARDSYDDSADKKSASDTFFDIVDKELRCAKQKNVVEIEQ